MSELDLSLSIQINLESKAKNIGRDMEKLESFCTAGRTEKWCSCFGKQYGGSSES